MVEVCGELGQVSERELGFLQSVAGSLNIGQSTEQLKSNLQRIRRSFVIVNFVIEAQAEGHSEKEIQNFVNRIDEMSDEELEAFINQ